MIVFFCMESPRFIAFALLVGRLNKVNWASYIYIRTKLRDVCLNSIPKIQVLSQSKQQQATHPLQLRLGPLLRHRQRVIHGRREIIGRRRIPMHPQRLRIHQPRMQILNPRTPNQPHIHLHLVLQ